MSKLAWAGLVLTGVLVASGCSDDKNALAEDMNDKTEAPATPQRALRITQAGRYQVSPFAFDAGAAEIVAYDPRLMRLYVVNSSARTVDVLDIADPDAITRIGQIDASAEGASANSVAVSGTTVAVAIEAETKTAPGKVVFYNASDFTKLGEATVGALPDMVTFTPNGRRVLVANEGEPADDYATDPEGSISVIDVSRGFQMPDVRSADFSAYNDQIEALRERGVRIFGPRASVAQDLELEYIAVADDGETAYVSLQENNAIATVDIENARVTAIHALGEKDFSLAGQGIDPSNSDGLDIRKVPVFGLYQPDTIAVFTDDDMRYLLTANEGDARDYDGFSEEADAKDVTLDSQVFPNAAALQEDSALGDLKITTTLGDADDDGDYEALYAYGARSFSIRRAADAALIYDSADDFEQITGQRYGDGFNADNTSNDGDDRSDNKGPEPEALATGVIDGRRYAFIGLERMSGFMAYDITAVDAPEFVTYINNRDLDVDPESGRAGDLGPESIVFISADDSPIDDQPLLAVGNEVSGSTTLYRLHLIPANDDNDSMHNGMADDG